MFLSPSLRYLPCFSWLQIHNYSCLYFSATFTNMLSPYLFGLNPPKNDRAIFAATFLGRKRRKNAAYIYIYIYIYTSRIGQKNVAVISEHQNKRTHLMQTPNLCAIHPWDQNPYNYVDWKISLSWYLIQSRSGSSLRRVKMDDIRCSLSHVIYSAYYTY